MTPAERIAAAQAKRAALQAQTEEAYQEQLASDLEALADIEAEHGFDRVARVNLGGWVPDVGLPTLVAVRVPRSSEVVYKKFEQQINGHKEGSPQRLTAQHDLGLACLVYPPKTDEAARKAVLEYAPGILSAAAFEVVKRAQGNAAEEGKG